MNTKRILALINTFACTFACAELIYGRDVSAATELARINGTSISLEDFEQRYKENIKFFQFKAPSKTNVLDDLIKRELGVQEARKIGLDKDPAVLDRINTVIYHALIDKKLGKNFENIHITDEEAKAFYAKNPEIRTSHIFVGVKPDASKQQLNEAYAKIKKINDEHLLPGMRSGKMSFAEVAQRFSEGVAAPMGGDIDYQTKDKLDPTYYDTSVNLKTPGKVSGIIKSQFGYHIIKLTAIRPWEEVDKTQVKRMLFEQRRNEIFEKYMAQLRSQAKVTVRKELLKD